MGGLSARLKRTLETRCGRFGVPPLGGFSTAPPKGGTPNRIFKQPLSAPFHICAYVTAATAYRRLKLCAWRLDIFHRTQRRSPTQRVGRG
jgi:hypothetical protein